ncbi:MAG: hypothetical protein NT010_09705 [Proteobacteria bacterium]|nr:hypothetical protein [Pseudomonadota bacterium]
MKGVGVVFDIYALGGGFYGAKSWDIFMQNLRPEKIVGCTLHAGDTSETLKGGKREFCIAIFGDKLNVEAVKDVFSVAAENGLASIDRRFMLSPQLDSESFAETGTIDSVGRFVQNTWSRAFHDRCKKSDWGYMPASIPADISPELKTELALLQSKTVQVKKPWWKFWD